MHCVVPHCLDTPDFQSTVLMLSSETCTKMLSSNPGLPRQLVINVSGMDVVRGTASGRHSAPDKEKQPS